MHIKEKTFIITGAADGLGKQTCIQLLEMGANIAAIDINYEKLESLLKISEKYKNRLTIHKCDIANENEVSLVKEVIENEHNTIDGIINVAGIIQSFDKFYDLNYESIKKVINVNLYGVINITKTFLPKLLSNNNDTCIVNVSSMGGFLPVPGQSIYGASKAAVKLFTESLYAELLDTNISVTLVLPGAIDTNITENSNVKVNLDNESTKKYKMVSASKAANTIIVAMQKNKFRVLIGSDSKFMDKLYRLSPRFAVKFITKKMADLLK